MKQYMNTLLQKKILAMVKEDQDMRMSGKIDKKIGKKHVSALKNIIAKFSWPDSEMVGKEGADGAWLIAQHADSDVQFQEYCLKLMKEKAGKQASTDTNIAYLYDRVRVNQGKSQKYGTQFHVNKNGKFGPRPIRDRKNLEARRKKVGLGSFADYMQRLYKRQEELKKTSQGKV